MSTYSQFKRGDAVLSARSLICRDEVVPLTIIRRERDVPASLAGEWYHVRELDGSRYVENAEMLLCAVSA